MSALSTRHIPILVEPIVEAILEPFRNLPPESEAFWIVDATLGGGGHTDAFLKSLKEDPALSRHRVLGVDQDKSAIEQAEKRFADEIASGRLALRHSPFSELEGFFSEEPVLGVLADLGFSSDQLEDPSRGISFQSEGPLDMRLDMRRPLSAYELLQQISEKELVQILSEYGEERFSKRIAAALISARKERSLPQTTAELAELIRRSVPPPARRGRIHAATRTFQALRIAVNHELEELEQFLSRVIPHVRPSGRVAIISFHSLEDRMVKRVFKDRTSIFRQLTKKPLIADERELERNPRARSAKLRVGERYG